MKENAKIKVTFENQLKFLLLFGIIWGISELIVAPLLKTIFYPLNGFIVPFIILIYLLAIKIYLPSPGTIMLMTILAATVKYIFGEVILEGAFMAILFTGLLIELVFLFFRFSFISYLLAGVLVEFYNLLHPLISKGLFYEYRQFIAFKRWLSQVVGLGMSGDIPRQIVSIILIILHLVAGLLAGWLSWEITQKIHRKKQLAN